MGTFAKILGLRAGSLASLLLVGELAAAVSTPELIQARQRQDDFVLPAPLTTADLKDWSLEDKVGQLLMVGYRSSKQLEAYRPGGVVLFSWNLEGVAETKKIVEQIKARAASHLKAPLFIATDHEGGKILRIRRGMTPFPDAAALGSGHDPWLAFRVGKSMGLELASLGLNMNFAPVLDVGNARSFLANRVWGERGRRQAQSTVAFIRGLQSARILAVAKHFPGHGGTQVDSHLGLPQVNKSLEAIMREDIAPFQTAIDHGVQALMTAHVEMPAVDRGPASLSKVFLTDILRERMGFDGLVITDDLEMDGVAVEAETKSRAELAMRALKAGTDMILVVWSKERQDRIFARVLEAVRSGEVSQAWLDEKVLRILEIKRRFVSPAAPLGRNPFWQENLRRPESLRLASEVAQKAIQWLAGSEKELMEKFKSRWGEKWHVFVPDPTVEGFWRGFRPQDRLVYLPRRPRATQLKNLEKQLSQALKSQQPLVLVTPPRAEFSEDLFAMIRVAMSRRAMDQKLDGPVLWIHQGLRPLEVQIEPERIKIGLVSLHSTSAMSWGVVKEALRSGSLLSSSF